MAHPIAVKIKRMNQQLEQLIQSHVQQALAEDIGPGDITAALLPDHSVNAVIKTRQDMVLCGQAWAVQVMAQLDRSITGDWHYQDGEAVSAQAVICHLHGPVRSLLTAERTMLNFLQTLSATATTTRRYVDQLAQSQCQLLDTRKTLPGWRLAQKYAVRCGGGVNHRIGLFDAVLIKENHIQAAGSIAGVLQQARELYPDKLIEIEVETLAQLQQALVAKPDRIMLDNFNLAECREAVSITKGQVPLEISGNVTLENIAAFAESGVDYISVGAITKHIQAIDLTMQVIDE